MENTALISAILTTTGGVAGDSGLPQIALIKTDFEKEQRIFSLLTVVSTEFTIHPQRSPTLNQWKSV